LAQVQAYFKAVAAPANTPSRRSRPTTIAFLVDDAADVYLIASLTLTIQAVVRGGGAVVVPQGNPLANSPYFREILAIETPAAPSLAYGQAVTAPGFYLMETPTSHWTETITGLGATGAAVIVAYTAQPRPGHPFVPVLTVADTAVSCPDLLLRGNPDLWSERIYKRMGATLAGRYQPLAFAQNNIDFQLTRGWLGIST
jgi:hypothetical protein